ncbi:MAG: DMT family transporter [Burkholderiales bacterium]|nr:DMT family transporter [Burkholderiales bacterium]MDE2610277.1 DMT family transporter [Burkholderiales bacterium]
MHGAKPLWLKSAPFIFLLLWSAGFTIAKIGLAYVNPLTFLVLRYALVLLVLLPLLVVVRPPWPRTAAAWRHLAVVGLLIQAGYFSLFNLALRFGASVGGVALIVSLQPILVALLAPYMSNERISKTRWLGLGLGLVGAALVILARSAIEATSVLGILCALLALACITAGTLYEKRFGAPHHPVVANAVQYAVGLLVVLPLAWAFEPMHVRWSGPLILSLAYLVLANSLIAISLLLVMIRHGEASRVSALFFLVPPAAALIAWLMIGEHMPPLAWVGMGVAGLGVALTRR